MKTLCTSIIIVLLVATTTMAEDTMFPIFERIDDLLIRVDSGISLNSFAESFAEMKIEYKRAKAQPNSNENLLLNDRMKEVMVMLEDYAKVWKAQEVDGFKFVPVSAPLISRNPVGQCRIDAAGYEIIYGIPCVKKAIFDEMKPKVEKAKSAHYNGW